MSKPDDRDREIADLRERLSRLSQASLRITEDLDFNAVLQGVLDSARSLTGARYGAMTTFDDAGQVQDYLSSGLTSEEDQQLWLMPEGLQVLRALTDISGPLNVPDLMEHTRSLGFARFKLPLSVDRDFPVLAAPMFHRGAPVGHVFLGDKNGGEEFSREDEEILMLFASQAALVISNARRHREERRAKADLETLVNTSPVGVVVLDAPSGSTVSINREAKRIVESLRDDALPADDLLNEITCVRSDGREISLREFTIAELLSSGEAVRAEEIVLRVAGGRSVSVLLNATPIHSEEGQIASFVVTLQDMTPLEEQERMRNEFLAMVSHELRTPLTSIKGSAATALRSTSEIEPAVLRQFLRIIEDQADRMNDLVSDLLDVARIETGTLPVSPEPAEVAILVDRARNSFISSGAGNHLDIDIDPNLPLVLADRQRIAQVLGNLLSNASRSSPEQSTIKVNAVQQDVHVAFSVTDVGQGIPAESLQQLFRKFSRVESEEYGGDTGLGLAICKGIVEAHGGRIWAESDGPGLGARFTFTLPTVEEARGAAAEPTPPASERSPGRGQRASGERVRVLAVDDDPQTLRYLRDSLSQSGYAPIVTGEPDEALRMVEEERPQLVLLDLMLPGVDGIDLMKDILDLTDVPVIFLSAYGREELIAKAFDMGAVDYVVKPFSPTELAARIRAALRRRVVPEPSEPYVVGDLTIDYAERKVTLAGRQIELLAMEYRVLSELSANSGRVLTYQQLLERVWGDKNSGDLRPMRTIVSRLRRKLRDDADNPAYIFTEPRVGYRMPRIEPRPEGPPATA